MIFAPFTAHIFARSGGTTIIILIRFPRAVNQKFHAVVVFRENLTLSKCIPEAIGYKILAMNTQFWHETIPTRNF